MSIFIVGSEGSMGQRYQAILRSLGRPYTCADVHTSRREFENLAKACEGVIIATPTHTHFEFLISMAYLKVPILCEKPLSKSDHQLQVIRTLVNKDKLNLTMMMQYQMLDDETSSGDSSYDYFRHGCDGITWDCLQIIGLARSGVVIDEQSPIWSCKLNGKSLSLSDMDQAYVSFVKKWLRSPGDDIERLIDIHHKVMQFE